MNLYHSTFDTAVNKDFAEIMEITDENKRVIAMMHKMLGPFKFKGE